ncbi:MAG: transglutaminase family protein [Bacteroidales bacterium]|nr:transglutaminase family protein [Bacteroidales bacterium]
MSPNRLSYNGYVGDFTNWQSYGKWVYRLIEGRDELLPGVAEEIRNLTVNGANIKEKIATVYQYMQKRTRYVYVYSGIGGFQPVTAKDVHMYGYGDCKALSNYTKALLKAAGIESIYTEIGSGENQKN